MPNAGRTFSFSAKVWLYPGETASWHFVTLPQTLGQELKERFGKNARGWGSLPVTVTIGKTSWQTSIFPDKHSGSYLLPLKANVRRAEGVRQGDTVKIALVVR